MALLLAFFFVILRADFIQISKPKKRAQLVLADQPLDFAAFRNINLNIKVKSGYFKL